MRRAHPSRREPARRMMRIVATLLGAAVAVGLAELIGMVGAFLIALEPRVH